MELCFGGPWHCHIPKEKPSAADLVALVCPEGGQQWRKEGSSDTVACLCSSYFFLRPFNARVLVWSDLLQC